MSGDEWDLIKQIRSQAAASSFVKLGIGDDAAIVKSESGGEMLVTSDTLMEGVHFDLNLASQELVGRKALAVNLSDIAAMAGRPTAAFLTLVLPRSRGADFATKVAEGIAALADEHDVAIAGGDTNIWDGPAVIGVTLLGVPDAKGAVRRSGAKPGDWLMVTGHLGGSIHGRHLNFIPRVREAVELHQATDLHALIDLSDGLATDVQHLATESGVRIVIDPDAIPIHEDVDQSLPPKDRLKHALSDGEDFELLFTISAEAGQRLLDRPPFDLQLTHIGHVTEGAGCWLQREGEEVTPLQPSGWEHRFSDGQ